MSMRNKLSVLVAFLFMAVAVAPVGAVGLQGGVQNSFSVSYYESVFDENGYLKDPSPDLALGDHLMGVISIEQITAAGKSLFSAGPGMQLSGIYAHQIVAISLEDNPLDPYNPASTVAHFAFDAPSVSEFRTGNGDEVIDIGGLLGAGEMLAFWSDEGPDATSFETDGRMIDNIAKATDGTPWLTLGLEDAGYFYFHIDPLARVDIFGGLVAMKNNTGHVFAPVNDPLENEINSAVSLFLNDTPGFNPNFGVSSPWLFASNTSAVVVPTPEPSTWLLFVTGLAGCGLLHRKKKNNSA